MSWLEGVLESAAIRGWCVEFGCTTCGAREFRGTLKHRLNRIARTGTPRSPRADFEDLHRFRRQRVVFTADECRQLLIQLHQLNEPGELTCERKSYPYPLTILQEAIVSIERECRGVLGQDEATAIAAGFSCNYAQKIIERDQLQRAERAKKRQEYLSANASKRISTTNARIQPGPERRLTRKLERDRSLIDIGESRYGTECSRPELFRKLYSDGLLGGFWN